MVEAQWGGRAVMRKGGALADCRVASLLAMTGLGGHWASWIGPGRVLALAGLPRRFAPRNDGGRAKASGCFGHWQEGAASPYRAHHDIPFRRRGETSRLGETP